MRSYQGYYTRSHQNSEVKRLWAGIVLGWVTSREVPVLHPPFLPFYLPLYTVKTPLLPPPLHSKNNPPPFYLIRHSLKITPPFTRLFYHSHHPVNYPFYPTVFTPPHHALKTTLYTVKKTAFYPTVFTCTPHRKYPLLPHGFYPLCHTVITPFYPLSHSQYPFYPPLFTLSLTHYK